MSWGEKPPGQDDYQVAVERIIISTNSVSGRAEIEVKNADGTTTKVDPRRLVHWVDQGMP
jgi:hypothetical protein